MAGFSLDSVEAVVGSGRAVISADDGTVVAAVRDALRHGRSATFYLTPGQAATVKSWYWTPQRVEERGLEPVSNEELARIGSELRIEGMGHSYSNRIVCECGAVYGAFEFVQQGVAEHGKEQVDAVLALEDVYVLRVNPVNSAVCPACTRGIIVGHEYDMTGSYGCCRSEAPV
ncbi:hypothetical protein [Streptomyces sp. SP18CS02]|uniref:hypothetical protein n=1 Tax=Streptomyces sp. SP18CS02 TaxID=3002531 RepID=UPI002E76D660|nr:hypothetical protein [Streptomyces sp. SP18CS02]MEE1754277.1 hypothetical protein [Streptomyces sp. SP18CS02]